MDETEGGGWQEGKKREGERGREGKREKKDLKGRKG